MLRQRKIQIPLIVTLAIGLVFAGIVGTSAVSAQGPDHLLPQIHKGEAQERDELLCSIVGSLHAHRWLNMEFFEPFFDAGVNLIADFAERR